MLLSANPAHAECQFNYRGGELILAHLIKNGSRANKEIQHKTCLKLKQANAAVQIHAHATVLGNMSIGWAQVTLADNATDIGTSSYGRSSTNVDPSRASQDRAYELVVKSIIDAIQGWLFLDEAIAELDRARANTAKALEQQG